MMETREPLPPALLKRLREVGALCVLAGCTADETIAACARQVERWHRERKS